jgi:hypothetical protein
LYPLTLAGTNASCSDIPIQRLQLGKRRQPTVNGLRAIRVRLIGTPSCQGGILLSIYRNNYQKRSGDEKQALHDSPPYENYRRIESANTYKRLAKYTDIVPTIQQL